MRLLIVVPALNEESAVASVAEKARAVASGCGVLVVDDGSTDGTAAIAGAAGAMVLRLPYNLGIGCAVQAGFMFAAEQGFDLCVQVDGDGQHDPAQIPALLGPLLAGEADMVVGSRFLAGSGYRMPAARRLGSAILAGAVSTITGQRFTDPTSGFRASNRDVVHFCARHYPSDYPEPEAIVLLHRAGFRIAEVPVSMQVRHSGTSSINAARSIYYINKVLLAILVGLLRPVPRREDRSGGRTAFR